MVVATSKIIATLGGNVIRWPLLSQTEDGKEDESEQRKKALTQPPSKARVKGNKDRHH